MLPVHTSLMWACSCSGAVKEFEILQQIAQRGFNDEEYIEDHIVGFVALGRKRQDELLQALLHPTSTPPEELPESQVLDVELTPRAAPKELRKPLQPFQKQGLSWLLDREASASTVCGGILADEMGMGKTLQILALLLASPAKGATLIVAPPTCLSQWREELADNIDGGIEVWTYRGTKTTLPERFCNKVVVLTTYGALERDFREQLNSLEEEPPRPRKRRKTDEANGLGARGCFRGLRL